MTFSVIEYENSGGIEYKTRIFTRETVEFVKEVTAIGGTLHSITLEGN